MVKYVLTKSDKSKRLSIMCEKDYWRDLLWMQRYAFAANYAIDLKRKCMLNDDKSALGLGGLGGLGALGGLGGLGGSEHSGDLWRSGGPGGGANAIRCRRQRSWVYGHRI